MSASRKVTRINITADDEFVALLDRLQEEIGLTSRSAVCKFLAKDAAKRLFLPVSKKKASARRPAR